MMKRQEKVGQLIDILGYNYIATFRQEQKQPRERESNWSSAEKEFLRECVNLRLDIVEHKGNDASMILKKKNAWKSIWNAMASAGFNRDIPKLKAQWVRMEVSARKAVATIKRASVATGNSVIIPEISDEDNLVQSMISNEFEEDGILIDSNCVDKYSLVDSPIAAEYLDIEVHNDNNNNEHCLSVDLTKSPKSLQEHSINTSAQKIKKDDLFTTTPLKCIDNVKKNGKSCSSSKLQRLKNLPKAPSKDTIILERQRQILKESLNSEEVTNLQKEKLLAEIENLKQEKEFCSLKLLRLRKKIEHDKDLYEIKLDLLRKMDASNCKDLFKI